MGITPVIYNPIQEVSLNDTFFFYSFRDFAFTKNYLF